MNVDHTLIEQTLHARIYNIQNTKGKYSAANVCPAGQDFLTQSEGLTFLKNWLP